MIEAGQTIENSVTGERIIALALGAPVGRLAGYRPQYG